MTSELQDQSQKLPRRTLHISLLCLTASLFVSFFDQTAVTTSIPSIGKTLGNSSLIQSWTGTSYLISNTNFQLLYGRFSDIFGRKQVFLLSLACLFTGNIISGFSVDTTMLFVARGISGLGGGGINCLVMVCFSDLLTTRQRGKYFGFVALSTTLGNGLGPLIGGVFSEKVSWRWSFWISCPIAVVSAIVVAMFVPLKSVTGSFGVKLKMVDWFGFLGGMVSTIFILVAISGGGSSWSWSSATFICLIVIGAISFFLFLYNESKVAIPMVPLHLFSEKHKVILFSLCFLMGWNYFVDIYYYPLYLQNIRGWSSIMSGVIQLPATCSGSIFGIIAGFCNSKFGNYVACLWFGGAMWTLGVGLKIMFTPSSSVGLLIGSNLIQGLGIGFTFQPTLLALLSHSEAEERAVVTGLRNFFRCLGGSVGLIVCGLIFQAIFRSRLSDVLSDEQLIDSVIMAPSAMSSLEEPTRHLVIEAYMHSFRIIMILLTAASGAMFFLSLFTTDGNDDEKSEDREQIVSSDEDVSCSTSDLEPIAVDEKIQKDSYSVTEQIKVK